MSKNFKDELKPKLNSARARINNVNTSQTWVASNAVGSPQMSVEGGEKERFKKYLVRSRLKWAGHMEEMAYE